MFEGLNDSEDPLQVVSVIGGFGISAVQVFVGKGRVDIEDHIETSGIEDGHAKIMIGYGVDSVDPNSVCLCCVGNASKEEEKDHSEWDIRLAFGG